MRNCSECAINFGPNGQCDVCLLGWSGENCDYCAKGWTGENCSECTANFGPNGQCDQCLRGWVGNNCSDCHNNFGPPGQCDTCLARWTGPNCDACEGFGLSTESNCSECIRNGYWAGTYLNSVWTMTADLTFDGPDCTNLVPGM